MGRDGDIPDGRNDRSRLDDLLDHGGRAFLNDGRRADALLHKGGGFDDLLNDGLLLHDDLDLFLDAAFLLLGGLDLEDFDLYILLLLLALRAMARLLGLAMPAARLGPAVALMAGTLALVAVVRLGAGARLGMLLELLNLDDVVLLVLVVDLELEPFLRVLRVFAAEAINLDIGLLLVGALAAVAKQRLEREGLLGALDGVGGCASHEGGSDQSIGTHRDYGDRARRWFLCDAYFELMEECKFL